jgi:hypothetical protein
MALPPGARQPLKLFPLDTPALAVYNRMNGQISLEANARCLVHETGWSAQRCLAYVRGLFLWLILARVCVPKDRLKAMLRQHDEFFRQRPPEYRQCQ